MKPNLINLKNFGFEIDNSLRKKYSESKHILLNEKSAEALLKAKNNLPKNYNLKIKDGFRTLAEQKRIVKNSEKEFKKSHPKNWKNLLKIYTGGYEELKLKKFSFMNHRSGNAVDLTSTKNKKNFRGNSLSSPLRRSKMRNINSEENKKELNLGGVKLNEKDKLNYYENKSKLSSVEKKIKQNRKLLRKIMTKFGFKSCRLEWWHWGFGK